MKFDMHPFRVIKHQLMGFNYHCLMEAIGLYRLIFHCLYDNSTLSLSLTIIDTWYQTIQHVTYKSTVSLYQLVKFNVHKLKLF